MFLLSLVDSKNIQTKMKYPISMSHIQHKYQTRDDFKLLYSNIKHKWKCSNIM